MHCWTRNVHTCVTDTLCLLLQRNYQSWSRDALLQEVQFLCNMLENVFNMTQNTILCILYGVLHHVEYVFQHVAQELHLLEHASLDQEVESG